MTTVTSRPPEVRLATTSDAGAIGQLLHDFNTEFDEPTPGPARLAERISGLLAGGDTTVLVGGAGPDGVVIPVSGRPSGVTLWSATSRSCTSPRSTAAGVSAES